MNRTDLTLLEQMRISEIDIIRRKELLGLTEEDVQNLVSVKSLIEDKIDDIVLEFYGIQTSIDEIALLIGDADTLGRLQKAQKQYVIDLFNGFYDMEYVNNRLRIGMVHKRIGVEPRLYLSAVVTLKYLIIKTIKNNISDPDKRSVINKSLDKLLYFDTTLIFDTYIRSMLSEIEASKDRAETYARSLEDKVAERTHQLELLSRKDALTGLLNQRSLYELLRRDLQKAKRSNECLCLVYFDVDKFKKINDQKGHQEGDRTLITISQALKAVSREIDSPCRYGGDEFCVILPDCDLDGAEKYCERFIKELKKKNKSITLSIGIAQTGPDHHIDSDELIKHADSKMYESKKTKGFCIKTYQPKTT